MSSLGIEPADVVGLVAPTATDDLLALTGRDPAARGSWRYVLEAYLSLRAVLTYRLAHALCCPAEAGTCPHLVLARQMAEHAKVATGVEIHPRARLGDRFVVDHGTGTVIGEDVLAGSDCYVLQGVVLGARGIADNVSGRRHPDLGDRVQVGGFARILGPISVGDDVVVGCHALVTSDVPAGAKVSVVQQLQVVRGPDRMAVDGVSLLEEGDFALRGRGFDHADLSVEVLDSSWSPLPRGRWSVRHREAGRLVVRVQPRGGGRWSGLHIRMRSGGAELTVELPVTAMAAMAAMATGLPA